MQFTPPYNELFSNVIAPVCQDLGLIAVRADETYGPGLIIADIVRDITEAKVIIAEITPANPNVYYEVGYAHALNKPTILIAEKPTQLPFDVSPFRVLFYENTIGGKAKIEAGLRKHLEAIQRQWTTT
jgi:predicted acetyltransferase